MYSLAPAALESPSVQGEILLSGTAVHASLLLSYPQLVPPLRSYAPSVLRRAYRRRRQRHLVAPYSTSVQRAPYRARRQIRKRTPRLYPSTRKARPSTASPICSAAWSVLVQWGSTAAEAVRKEGHAPGSVRSRAVL
eukprot:557481-Rhodomonas_salina.1